MEPGTCFFSVSEIGIVFIAAVTLVILASIITMGIVFLKRYAPPIYIRTYTDLSHAIQVFSCKGFLAIFAVRKYDTKVKYINC